MRRVDRSSVPPPPGLIDPGGPGAAELTAARAHYAHWPNDSKLRKKFKKFEFAAYKDNAVKRALRGLFFGKCAYCETYFESSEPVDVEHYRPKSAVSDDRDHPGYWWLAMAWTNLLPSCIDCNRKRKQIAATTNMKMADLERLLTEQAADDSSGKKDSFPTADNVWIRAEGPVVSEKPLLIDPTNDNPLGHFRWPIELELSVVLPADRGGQEDARGVASIAVYGLNRLGLVQERTRLLNRLRKRRRDIFDLLAEARTTTDPRTARNLVQMAVQWASELREWCKPDQPYSVMANAFVDRLEHDIRAALNQ